MTTALLVISAASAVSQQRQQRKSRRAQEKAVEVQGKRAALENAKARRQQVAQARRARAATIAQGQAAGIGGGSQVAGAAGAVTTQGATNVSFLNQLEGFDRARFGALSEASTAQGRAATFGAIGRVAQSPAGSEVAGQITSFLKR